LSTKTVSRSRNKEFFYFSRTKKEKNRKKSKKEKTMSAFSESIVFLTNCAERQKRLFYENFLSRHKRGEILCVQNEQEDTVLFERWEIHGRGFISCTVLLCEDSLIQQGISAQLKPIMQFVEEREVVNKKRFQELIEHLEKQGTTLEEAKERAIQAGQPPTPFIYSEITRDTIEERLPPGKKTIQGDRSSEILVLERQKDVPSDVQQARLNVYHIPIPDFIARFTDLSEVEEIGDWITKHTQRPEKSIPVATTLPFFNEVHYVRPIIYEWPDKEVDIEKAVGYK